MGIRVIPPEQVADSADLDHVMILRHIMAKIKADEAKKEQAEVRPYIVGILEQIEPDGEGHRTLVLEEPIMGYGSLQYQRRVSVGTPAEDIIERLEALDLLDSCTQMVRVPNEEAILNAVYDGRISEEELAVLYPKKETFAVVVKRA